MKLSFSDYIVYVDESGDHGLQTLDPNYPLFVLAFCIFHKRHYNEVISPVLQKFKFQHFGHDLVILHEHDIRKEKGVFTRFRSREERMDFVNQLTDIIEKSHFVITCCVIEKQLLRQRYQAPDNPYHLALAFGLERIYQFLQEQGQEQHLTHIVVEKRGKKEDAELELEFRRISSGTNAMDQSLPFALQFADKRANSAGLQLADLVARPVGIHMLRPEQSNRAFDVIRPKLYCQGGQTPRDGGYDDWGLKCFPPTMKE